MKQPFVPFILLAMAMVPLATAVFLYHNPQYLSGKSTVQGRLFVPPLDARPLVGNPGLWQLLLFVDEDCSTECRRLIYYARQVHEALAKDKGRVERKLLMREGWSVEDRAAFTNSQKPPLLFLAVTAEQEEQLFPVSSFKESELENSLFVVDPNGNLILQHRKIMDAAAAKALLQDLKKLLRASRIG